MSQVADKQPSNSETLTNRNKFDMPNDRESGSYYTLQKMNQMHHEIVRRIVAGQKDHEIAKALDISKAMVKYTKESPIVQQKLDIMMGARDASAVEVRKQIEALAPLALHEMSKIMVDEDASEAVRSKIGMDILDRAGFGAVDWKGDVNKLSKDKISELKSKARSNGLIKDDPEQAEDADFEEINDEE